MMAEMTLDKLHSVYDKLDQYIKEQTEYIRQQEIQHKILGAASHALKQAVLALGKGQDADIYNMADDALMQQDSAALASIDEDLRFIDDATTSMDLKNARYDEQAYQQLEAWKTTAALPAGNTSFSVINTTPTSTKVPSLLKKGQ